MASAADRQRAISAAEFEHYKSHGSPGRKIQDAIVAMERLLRATALIPEVERTSLILAAERDARHVIERLRPLTDPLHRHYFPSAHKDT